MKKNVINIVIIALLFALLLLPSFCAMAMAIDLEYSLIKKVAYLAIVVLLLLVPALFLKARTYFIIEGVCNFLFFPIDVASLYLNKQSCSTAFLQNIYHTDWHEAVELLASLWPVVLAVVALWVLYFVLAAKVKNTYLLNKKVRLSILIALPVVAGIGLLAMAVLLTRLHSERSFKSTLEDATGLVVMKFYKIYPYNLYLETADIIRNTHEQHQMQKEVSSFTFGLTNQKSKITNNHPRHRRSLPI